VVAAVLARSAAAAGARVRVFKPAVSGLEEGGEPDHEVLRRASGSSQCDDEIAPYRYAPAVSPHLGAELAGEPIDPARLLAAAERAAAQADVVVVEGVGGLLVPLTLGYLVRDFARELGLPVVIAAGPGLGTINHTLLTVEGVRAIGLEVAAVVLTPWPAKPGELERSNREAIERCGRVRVETLALVDLADTSAWPSLTLEEIGQ
jgi:dethiobiotin synthetase